MGEVQNEIPSAWESLATLRVASIRAGLSTLCIPRSGARALHRATHTGCPDLLWDTHSPNDYRGFEGQYAAREEKGGFSPFSA